MATVRPTRRPASVASRLDADHLGSDYSRLTMLAQLSWQHVGVLTGRDRLSAPDSLNRSERLKRARTRYISA